jgi:hypothetical protein
MVVQGGGTKNEFIANYFVQLFRSGNHGNIHAILEVVQERVTDAMNQSLTTTFTEEEIKSALDSIGDLKAPVQMGCRLFSTRVFGMLWAQRSHRKYWVF